MEIVLVPITSEVLHEALADIEAAYGPKPAWNNGNFVNAKKTTKTRTRAVVDGKTKKVYGYVIWSYEVRDQEARITRLVLLPEATQDSVIKTIIEGVERMASAGLRVTARVPVSHVETCVLLSKGGLKPKCVKGDTDFVQFEVGSQTAKTPPATFNGRNRITRV